MFNISRAKPIIRFCAIGIKLRARVATNRFAKPANVTATERTEFAANFNYAPDVQRNHYYINIHYVVWYCLLNSSRKHMPQSGQTDPRFVQKHTQKSSPAHDNFLRGSPGKVIFYGSRTHYFFSFYKELF